MKSNFKTFTLAIAVVAVTLGVVIATSCSKDETVASSKNQTSTDAGLPKVKQAEYYIIGKVKDGTVVYAFDRNTLVEQFHYAGDTLLMESFTILDEHPETPDGMAEVKMVFYNIASLETETYWTPIVKSEGKYLFATDPNGNEQGRGVKCVSKKSCRKAGGQCEKKVENGVINCHCSGEGECREGMYFSDVVTAVVGALETIGGILKEILPLLQSNE